GAVQVTLAPAPLKVPASADHVKVSCDTGVSASVTAADTETVSSRSANCVGSRGFWPLTTTDEMTGSAFTTYKSPPGSDAACPLTVTTTSAGPAACAGALAVIELALAPETAVAAAPPIVTEAPTAKFAPLMVTVTPPLMDAARGVIPVTRGAVEDGDVEEPPHADTAAASTSAPAGR